MPDPKPHDPVDQKTPEVLEWRGFQLPTVKWTNRIRKRIRVGKTLLIVIARQPYYSKNFHIGTNILRQVFQSLRRLLGFHT